nr:winged helix-turn-helix transcriptional regulator [Corallococcus exercitus]
MLRFGELRKHIPSVTQRMLTQNLRKLEAGGLVHQQVYAEVPQRIEYSLTPKVQTLHEDIAALMSWGEGEVHLGQKPLQQPIVTNRPTVQSRPKTRLMMVDSLLHAAQPPKPTSQRNANPLAT